jgi:hypothetical protein
LHPYLVNIIGTTPTLAQTVQKTKKVKFYKGLTSNRDIIQWFKSRFLIAAFDIRFIYFELSF